MKMLMMGGPLDGQLHDLGDQQVDPRIEATIQASLPDGSVLSYRVVFFAGEKSQFPIAVLETLGPDDVFKALLQWYAVKPRVRPITPADKQVMSVIDAKSEPVDESVAEPVEETEAGPVVVPFEKENVEEHCGPKIALD
jgi:hypothetical protein